MAKFRRCLLFLVNAAAGLLSVSGAGITLKYGCPGGSVQAFQNIDFDRCNALVSFHINGKRNTEIASWLWQNCTLNVTIVAEYNDRVFLDQNGIITIRNLHPFDQGKYIVISKKDALPSIKEVLIHVMVAPSKDCKPMIEQLGNTLIASLQHDDCGTPVATLYWKGYGGVSDTNGPLLKIKPGTESRTYYACIQGPALQCAKSQMPLDNCSPIIIKGNSSRTMSSESSSTAGFIAVIIVLGILLSLAIVAIMILILKRRRRRSLNGEHTTGFMDATCPKDKYFDDINTEHDKILQLCNTDLDNLRSPSNDQHQSLKTRSDMDFEMNEVGTDHQSGIDPEPSRELQELRDAALCKICFANKKSVFFMPCNHAATCDDCSTFLDNCPVCRARIKERQIICYDSYE